jgi:acyl-CoA synthetase (AMP-forming)/AMP-acid ligase II
MQMSKATDSPRLLWTASLRSCQKYPTHGAIDVGGREVTYEQLANRVKRLAATLQVGVVAGAVPLTAVFVYRSETAYAAILGGLMAGHAGVHAASNIFGPRPVPAKCERQIRSKRVASDS